MRKETYLPAPDASTLPATLELRWAYRSSRLESQPWTWLLVVKLIAAAVTLAAPFTAVAIAFIVGQWSYSGRAR